MKPRWIVLTAIITGFICGFCAAILSWPEKADVASESVDVAAAVLDHEQGNSRSTIPTTLSSVETADALESPDKPADWPIIVSSETLDTAFANADVWTVPKGTRILLVPHHLVAARQIASLLAATSKPSVAYLVTPDHFGACRSVACAADIPAASFLKDTDGVSLIALQDFAHEHAVTGLEPFLRRAWGEDMMVLPIMVRSDATEKQTTALIAALITALQQDRQALLVDSIDASHYQPAEVADFHDVLTQDVISSLADKEVGRAEIDAPAVLRVALRTARDLGLGDVTIHAHTNSLRLMQAQISQDSTSHFLASFAPGAIRKQQDVTLLFLGDMMFDRTVADRSQKAGDLSHPFQKILGEENRFFRGQDLVIGNLEGPVTTTRLPPDKGEVDFMFDLAILPVLKQVGIDAVSQANNHALDQGRKAADRSRATIKAADLGVFGDQVLDNADHALTILESRGQKIALVGFNVTDNALDKEAALMTLQSAEKQADHIVVYMHWGNEYQAKPDQKQADLAHWLIDQGADAIIGSHPHWMQSVEVYKDKPIAYSLGNFIFDQDWSKETVLGLVVGLKLDAQESVLYLYPIQIAKSQPILLTGEARQARLDYLASVSDSSLSSSIKSGTITTHD